MLFTLIDDRNVARGDLDLRTDGFNTTSSFALEDETTGVSEFGFFTVLVVDASDIVSSIFQSFTDEGASVARGSSARVGCRTSTVLGAILAEERNVHGLVDLDTSNLHNALTGLQAVTLLIPVDQSVVANFLDQCIVLLKWTISSP